MEKIKYHLLFLSIIFILFIIFIYNDVKHIGKFNTVTYKDSIYTIVNIKQNRGDIFLNERFLIKANIPVLQYPKSFSSWEALRPTISFINKGYQYKLGDIEIPYLLVKKKYNDTLYAIKDKDTLLLLLSDMIIE